MSGDGEQVDSELKTTADVTPKEAVHLNVDQHHVPDPATHDVVLGARDVSVYLRSRSGRSAT